MKVKVINRSAYGLPQYETGQAAGLDVRANITESITLGPLERALVPTGLYVELPEGYEMQVRPRSGLAAKHGLSLVNAPGLIDSSYRGEIKAIAINLDPENVLRIQRGDRVAQLVIMATPLVTLSAQEELEASERGAGGFGSSGSA